VIRDPECVSKSFPGFFETLEALGLRVRRLS
jgi:5-enolpyruvylshikimate-3-phosphate synthase